MSILQGDFGLEETFNETSRISNLQSQSIKLEELLENHQQYFKQVYSLNKKSQNNNQILMITFTGQMRERGILYFKNGNIQYQRDFIANKFEGFGTLFNEKSETELSVDYHDLTNINLKGCWIKYQGTFQKGEKQGYGQWVLTDDAVLLVNFEKDKVHGDGYLKRPQHQDTCAIWQNGILHKVILGKL